MGAWFDHEGRSLRGLDHWKREEPASAAFRRMFLQAFAAAALLGLLIGVLWTLAGLWHFHVSPLF
jgi:hypothetical protein